MRKSKIVQLLKSCSPLEIQSLQDFLASPYYNQDETIIRFFNYLKTFYPHFDAPALSKKNIFQQIFPNEAYDDKQLRYLISNLNKLSERFLAIRGVEQQPYQSTLSLLKVLSEKGLEKSYSQVTRQVEQEMNSRIHKDNAFFLTQLHWSEIKEQHFQQQRIRKFDPSLQHFADNLDKYYFLNRLKIACAMLDRQTIFQTAYSLNLSEEWVQHLEQQKFFNEPIIEIYYIIFQALLNEDKEDYFTTLKKILNEHISSIATEDLKDMYLFAINYCARKIRQGKETYVSEALHLYRTGIEMGLLIDRQGLSPWAFTNVIKLSLRLQYYTWIESFIQEYAPKLPETFRENALHYNMAELYYYTRRFGKAQEHLNQVAFSDLNYYLGARVLLAKIFYETKEEEALLSLISSFTIFLKRNKQISNDLKYTYLNFCQILFQIVRWSPSQMNKLKEKINSTKLLTDRTWLEAIYNQAQKH